MTLDYYDNIQKAIDFIEDHLLATINLEEVAAEAGFSLFHFQRIFRSMTGDSLKQYIRKRRLTYAAKQLLNTQEKILTIALECDFQSQESFTRAFRKFFQTTPGEFRKNQTRHRLKEKTMVSRRTLDHFQGGFTMEPKITVLKEFTVLGISRQTTAGSPEISQLWQELRNRLDEIPGNLEPDNLYGVVEYTPNPQEDEFTYLASVNVKDAQSIPQGMIAKTIPKTTYAIFTHKGDLSMLKDTYEFIYATWLPNSGYQLAETDELEIYDLGSNNPDFQICIPITS